MIKDTGGQAFPHPIGVKEDGRTYPLFGSGMALRDYIAIHAPDMPPYWGNSDKPEINISAWRWAYADAMLTERGKDNNGTT